MKKIILYDINPKMCDSWDKDFKDIDEVEIKNIKFKNLEATYVVTAGNSYGVMSGGLDLYVRSYFGIYIQDLVQHQIFFNGNKKLEVGECIVVPTGDKSKENLVYAPTMETPKNIDNKNVYLAMKAVLEECYQKDGIIAIPGLGTGVGNVKYEDCSKTMLKAYNDYKKSCLK